MVYKQSPAQISDGLKPLTFDSCIVLIFRSFRLTDLFLKLSRPDPGRTSHLSLLKVLLVSSLGLYIGAAVSQKMASFLEENDLFVPEDDDDDWTLNCEYYEIFAQYFIFSLEMYTV